MAIDKKRLILLVGLPIAILMIPLVAMQFTSEVSWNVTDFVIAGGLLFSVALGLDFAYRKIKEKKTKILMIVAILVLFLLLWAEMAVGIFGSPLAGN